MPSYLIANITIEDADAFAAYQAKVKPMIAMSGGRTIISSTDVRRLEGDVRDRVVIVEFQDDDGADRFYRSQDYLPLIDMRNACSKADVFIVPGLRP
ncbi:MAG: DUF1330 domain-containing protein [Rhizobiaceae bacterium]